MATDTSINAYRNLDAKDQYNAILSHLREISPDASCIADIARDLYMERSTVSARLNELKTWGGYLEYAGKKQSRATGIMANHWRVKSKATLF